VRRRGAKVSFSTSYPDKAMLYRIGADAVLLLHLAFILFVVFGALAAVRSRRWIAIHLGAVAWGCVVELAGLVCPLTHLENMLRAKAGQAQYAGDFIDRYLLGLIYPDGLTRGDQLVLGLAVVAVNAAIYGWLLLGRRAARPG
jgi:hypothetical protein